MLIAATFTAGSSCCWCLSCGVECNEVAEGSAISAAKRAVERNLFSCPELACILFRLKA